MIDNNLDALIKKAFKMRYEENIYPPSHEVWEKVIKRLRKQRRKDVLKRLRPVIAACIVLAVLSIGMFSGDAPVMAFANKVIQSIEKFAGNTFIIYKSVDKRIPDNSKKINDDISDPRINDAQNKVSFKILLPRFLPEGYNLSKVDTSNEIKDQQSVALMYYAAKKTEDKSDFIQIIQTSMSDGTKMSMNIKTDKDTQIKHIDIKGMDATLINYDNGLNKIIWDSGHMNYKIDGTVDEKTIIKIAKSME